MNNQTNRKQTPRREPRMPGMKGNSGTGEKAKDFKGTTKKLINNYLSKYKIGLIDLNVGLEAILCAYCS